MHSQHNFILIFGEYGREISHLPFIRITEEHSKMSLLHFRCLGHTSEFLGHILGSVVRDRSGMIWGIIWGLRYRTGPAVRKANALSL